MRNGDHQPLPLHPRIVEAGGREVQRWEPSPIAFDPDWLRTETGTSADQLRYAYAPDDVMTPILPRNALVLVEAKPVQRPASGLVLLDLGYEIMVRRLNRLPDNSVELVADSDLTWRYPLPVKNPPKMHCIRWHARSA